MNGREHPPSTARFDQSRSEGRIELSAVVPLFDEEALVPILVKRLTRVLDDLGLEAEVILVDDGSRDGTLDEILLASENDSRFLGLALSRNFGHQAAISAGLIHARGDAVVIMDGDLQDPPEAIQDLWARYREGFDVVYAVRAGRPESWWKRWAYATFYRMLERTAAFPIPIDTGDFGVMSRRVVDVLNAMPERRRFLRGMRAWAGFRQTGVTVNRGPRYAGRPKFTIRKLVGLAIDGLIGFGESPLRWTGALGAAVVFGSLAIGFWQALRGASAGSIGATCLVFLGGAQLLSTAVLGEYVSRIFQEVNGRPAFVVRRRIGFDFPREPLSISTRRRRRRPGA